MLIRRFFSVLYLSAVIQSRKCLFYGEAYKGAKLLKTIKAEFDLDEPGVVSDRANEYVRNLQKEYKWVYLSLFFDALEQGAFEAKNADNLEKLGIKTKEITCINPTKNWLIYAKHSDVKAAEEKFTDIGVDVLYSPIALTQKEIEKHNLPTANTLFVYSCEEGFTICITSSEGVKYAAVCKENDEEYSDSADFDKENSDEIDDFIANVDESFNTMDGLDDLGEMLKMDDNDEEFADLDYDINMPESTDVTASVSIFGRDMSIYHYISLALKEFYTNPLYEGDFIENVVIFDATQRTSATFLHYIENELLVKTAVYPVNTLKTMTELMKKELEND